MKSDAGTVIVQLAGVLSVANKIRGDIPRSTYICKAVEYYLKQGKTR
jgi:hypothetical protein